MAKIYKYLSDYSLWLILFWIKPTNTTVTVTAYDSTGIVQQQPLTLGCNYTKGASDVIMGFSWKHGDVIIVSGSVTGQTYSFQTGASTGWESGQFLGDYTPSLTIQLPASSVTPSVAGQYTCVVSSRREGFQDTATATVQYAPQIGSTFPSSRPVTEFSRLQIDCSSYTTPGNPPTTNYTWTYGGSTVSSGAVLDINNIGRDRRGQYTCTASNTAGSSGASVTVDVQYAPQIGSTFPSSRPVTEFSRLQIDCSSYTTTGNPPTTSYTWTYGGSTVSSEAVLDINNIGRDRRGQYTCSASNTAGSSDANVTVDVQYLDRPDLTLDKTEVVENETVSLTCNVKSNPTAEQEIRNVDNDTVLVERDTNRLHFTIYRVQCLHNGSFLCSPRNTWTGDVSTSSRKELNVLCAPSINNRHPSITDVTRGLGDVASLTVNVLANPSPLFDWYLRKNEQLLQIPASTEHTIVSSQQASVLQIQLNNTRDYGTYAVVVRNSIGSLQMTFTVSPIPPESCLQEPDRLGLGVGIGVSVVIPVIIVILCMCFLLHRRETHHHKSTGNETIELPVQESTVTGEHKVYTELTVAESTVNEYEQLQIPQGQSQDYQNA